VTRRRSQAGLSLVELIIGMAVTSLVLSGIVAMVFTLTNSYNHWVGRIGNASSGDVLAAAIQADSHRLTPCRASTSELDFCLVDATVTVAYRTQGPAPYTVTRINGGGSQLMVRGLAARPIYHVDCDGTTGAGSGSIEVDNITGLGPLRVYFHSPLGPCQES
jgi:pilin/secretion family protein with methylation motif